MGILECDSPGRDKEATHVLAMRLSSFWLHNCILSNILGDKPQKCTESVSLSFVSYSRELIESKEGIESVSGVGGDI